MTRKIPKDATIKIRINSEMLDKVTQYARAHGMTRSAMIRLALGWEIAKPLPRTPAGSRGQM